MWVVVPQFFVILLNHNTQEEKKKKKGVVVSFEALTCLAVFSRSIVLEEWDSWKGEGLAMIPWYFSFLKVHRWGLEVGKKQKWTERWLRLFPCMCRLSRKSWKFTEQLLATSSPWYFYFLIQNVRKSWKWMLDDLIKWLLVALYQDCTL